MTRATKTPNVHTAARRENIRKLVVALQLGEMMRGDIAELLGMSPSGVRKYVKDLGAKIKIVRYVDPAPRTRGEPVFRLTIDDDQVEAYISSLASDPEPACTQPRSRLALALRDPRRHFHILADDTHYAIRVSRALPARDPLVAHLFGPAPTAAGAHA